MISLESSELIIVNRKIMAVVVIKDGAALDANLRDHVDQLVRLDGDEVRLTKCDPPDRFCPGLWSVVCEKP